MLVSVAFEFRLDTVYNYSVPPELENRVAVGKRVEASLGRSVRTGYIVRLNAPTEQGIDYKAISRVIDTEPVITPELMRLSEFIAHYYFCPLGKVLRCFLPAAVRKRSAAAVQVHVVRPALALETLRKHGGQLSRKAPRQASVLIHLIDFYENMPENAAQVLRLSELVARADTTTAIVRKLEEKGLVSITREKHWALESESFIPSGIQQLTPQQQVATDAIRDALGSFKTFLLHGVTGSGKTEVYLQVIKDVLDRGQGALVLVPEIALTPQTVDRFRSRFGEHVAVLHSDLAELDRCRQWWSIRDGHARIVVGARSAVFAPVKDLGIIVVDEEHERTYKQSEELPRYNARDIAVMRGKFQSCPVVLGTATPSLESIYNVEQNKYTLLDLPERVVAEKPPEIILVNLAEEAKVAPQLGVISRKLRDALQECLARNEQALLFLNRRGYCPILACPSCNYVKRCQQCSISMTYHTTREILLCHLCGYTEKYVPPYHCPACRQKLTLTGFGTQRIEKNIAYLFPEARISRMDRDTTSRRGSHERILIAFGRGEIDVLLGTQMIAKGLDFPNVTLVGVINADISLHIPDFRSTETTFQLVTQVAGRSGRGSKPGKVIVQSFTPEHPAISCAVTGDWQTYAENELAARKELSYPPYTHLIYLLIKGRDETVVILETEELCGRISKKVKATAKNGVYAAVLGPAPAPLALSHGYHRWQIILKVTSVYSVLEQIISPVLAQYKPNKVQVIVDVDPL